MKKAFTRTLLLLLIFAASASSYAQCKSFAKKVCKVELGKYIHDGNYHAAILTEGEEAELYKTFYSDQEYRIVICASESLPPVEFQVMDAAKNVLYDNKNNNLSNRWDFKLESSQQLKIAIKVQRTTEDSEEFKSGCVSIMFGFKSK